MRKRYKIILNVEVTDPDQPFPGGGDYTHLTRIEGITHQLLTTHLWPANFAKVTLDKVIDKGEVSDEMG